MKGLFGKEFKKVVTGLPYLIFVVALLTFFFTQFSTDFKRLEKPQPGQADYGTKYEEIPEILMPRAFDALLSEFSSNSYIAYPIGFYKNVRLNDTRQLKMAEIIAELSEDHLEQIAKLTDVKEENIQEYLKSLNPDDSLDTVQGKGNSILSLSDVKLDKSIEYDRFKELMDSADRCIGGGSSYSDLYLYRFGAVPKTYQDALDDYTAMAEKDKMTGAYARLFCDYMGIVLGLFPVFVAVAMGLKDKSARVNELMYTRKASSFSIVITRYLAMVVSMMIPVIRNLLGGPSLPRNVAGLSGLRQVLAFLADADADDVCRSWNFRNRAHVHPSCNYSSGNMVVSGHVLRTETYGRRIRLGPNASSQHDRKHSSISVQHTGSDDKPGFLRRAFDISGGFHLFDI